jgi:hypothetical protein
VRDVELARQARVTIAKQFLLPILHVFICNPRAVHMTAIPSAWPGAVMCLALGGKQRHNGWVTQNSLLVFTHMNYFQEGGRLLLTTVFLAFFVSQKLCIKAYCLEENVDFTNRKEVGIVIF